MQTYIQNLQHIDLLVTISSLQVIVFVLHIKSLLLIQKGLETKTEYLSTINIIVQREYYKDTMITTTLLKGETFPALNLLQEKINYLFINNNKVDKLDFLMQGSR